LKLILCEKPSQAQDVAKAFKNCKKKDGYVECGNFIITWGFGHLLEVNTQKIAPKGEIIVFPERFEYKPRGRLHAKQLKTIRELLKKAQEVYVFTDPEREGELIARLILSYAGWKKWDKTYRFWTSKALTPEVVWEEIRAKRPLKEFDPVYWEALARQHADWMVGIPLSRVLISTLGGKWSVGRVQTPTLALLVEREEERRRFKVQFYWVVKGTFKSPKGSFDAVLDKKSVRFKNEEGKEEGGLKEEEAKKVIEALRGLKWGEVKEVKRIKRREPPPLLHSLTTLQKEASQELGWSAQKTLSVAQSLYEKKLISYPRTESQHLSIRDKALVKEVLKKLGREDLIPAVDKVGKRVFDDTKLTDHFALIPLDAPKDSLSPLERKLYDLVKRRFLGAFMEDHQYEEIRLSVLVGNFLFRAKGYRQLLEGWRALYPKKKQETLPVAEGEKVKLEEVKGEKRKTSPPPRYSDGSLIELMKKLGLGTPATRSQVIESLIKRGYVRRRGKEIVPTKKGEDLIKELKRRELKISRVELTKEWEEQLRDIRKKKKNRKGYEEFISAIKNFVSKEAQELKKVKLAK